MSLTLLIALFAVEPSDTVGSVSDKLTTCVRSKADAFSLAAEGADVVVRAALAACLTQRAELRAATEAFVASKSGSKDAAQKSYDLIVSAISEEALVRVVTARAKNAEH